MLMEVCEEIEILRSRGDQIASFQKCHLFYCIISQPDSIASLSALQRSEQIF